MIDESFESSNYSQLSPNRLLKQDSNKAKGDNGDNGEEGKEEFDDKQYFS
jgi:hypothetical protein